MTGQGHTLPNTARLFDELLILHVQSGDKIAGERLATRWNARFLRTARSLLRDEEQARTAVQDCWVSILRGIGSLQDPSRFAPWAYGILRRRCADRIRKAQRSRTLDGELPEAVATAPTVDDATALGQAFASLPADQRLAAQLFFVEGLTLAEIAEVQDVPTGTAKSRLFHARRKLKTALTGDDQ